MDVQQKLDRAARDLESLLAELDHRALSATARADAVDGDTRADWHANADAHELARELIEERLGWLVPVGRRKNPHSFKARCEAELRKLAAEFPSAQIALSVLANRLGVSIDPGDGSITNEVALRR